MFGSGRKNETIRGAVLFVAAVALGAAIPALHAASPSAPATKSSEPIALLDLRHASRIDLKNPAQVQAAWDDCHAAATLQGIVNRDAPRLYLIAVNSQYAAGLNIDEYWLNKFSAPGEWLSGRPRRELRDVVEAVEAYRGLVKGAVVWDPNVPATSNVASAAAGAEDLVAVRYDPAPGSLYSRLVTGGPRLAVRVWLVEPDGRSKFTGKGTLPDSDRPSTGSAKCDAYLWMKHRYMESGKCTGEFGAYYLDFAWTRQAARGRADFHTLFNHDYFVSKRAFFFDLDPWDDERATDDPAGTVGLDCRTMIELLRCAYEHGGRERMIHIGGFPPWLFKYTRQVGGPHEEVATEWEYTKIISAFNGFQDADALSLGAFANASFWTHFPLAPKYPQKWVTREELQQRGYLLADGSVNRAKRYFIFYVGDYDSAAWVYQAAHKMWDDPNRGKLPLMWSVSPVIERRAPMAMHYFYRTATPNDYFASADNGAGYLNPGMLQEPRPISNLPSGLDAWAKHCKAYYGRWSMTVTGFVIDGFAPGLDEKGLDCYASFSPNGIVPQKAPPLSLHGHMPVLHAQADVGLDDPIAAAHMAVDELQNHKQTFNWFRCVLKTPTWYVTMVNELKSKLPDVELVEAPVFWELMRIDLERQAAKPKR